MRCDIPLHSSGTAASMQRPCGGALPPHCCAARHHACCTLAAGTRQAAHGGTTTATHHLKCRLEQGRRRPRDQRRPPRRRRRLGQAHFPARSGNVFHLDGSGLGVQRGPPCQQLSEIAAGAPGCQVYKDRLLAPRGTQHQLLAEVNSADHRQHQVLVQGARPLHVSGDCFCCCCKASHCAHMVRPVAGCGNWRREAGSEMST